MKFLECSQFIVTKNVNWSPSCSYSFTIFSFFQKLLPFLFPSLFFFIEVQLTQNVTLVSGVQHNDSTSLHVMLCSLPVQLLSVTIQHYYNTIAHMPYAVPLISVPKSGFSVTQLLYELSLLQRPFLTTPSEVVLLFLSCTPLCLHCICFNLQLYIYLLLCTCLLPFSMNRLKIP